MDLTSLWAGFALSISLILAIGAQNAFVLRQGIARRHVFLTCLICALSDALLITAGVAGFGALAEAVPWLDPAMRLFGAAFLAVYGAQRLYAAWKGGESLTVDGNGKSLRTTILTVLALTWLNPHVYLDTVMLIGSVSAGYAARPFAIGAVSASFFFFFTLGYGARLLAPVFARPTAWRVFEAGIGLTMWVIAVSLLMH